MRTHLTLVTGASRGLGRALAVQLVDAGHRLLTLSRHPDPGLAARAPDRVEAWAVDLSEPLPVAERLRRWLAAQDASTLASATLINNAALVTEPAPLADTGADELSRALRVGLEAPTLLCAAFLDATRDWPLPRKVLNVSSGLGRRAMAGSAAYCAVKAGLDHLTRALALEEAARPHGAVLVSLAPGVIDTDMQVQLRGADAARFPERERFIALKRGGQLDTPAAAAAKLLRYLARPDFGSQPVADVREG